MMEFRFLARSVPIKTLFFVLVVMSMVTLRTDASLSETWDNLKNSDAIQQAQKEWYRARTKTQSFMSKVSSGKIADDITGYIDNTLMKLFSIRVSELQKTLKKAQQTWLGPTLLAVWVLVGYITHKLTSMTSCLVVMSTTLLVHSIYGSVVVFTQVVIFIGLSMYFISLIANNMVLSIVTIVTVYVSYSIFGVCRRTNSHNVLFDVEDRVADLNQRTSSMETKMEAIEQKIDRLLEGRE